MNHLSVLEIMQNQFSVLVRFQSQMIGAMHVSSYYMSAAVEK